MRCCDTPRIDAQLRQQAAADRSGGIPRILLRVDTAVAYGRGILTGLQSFARGDQGWECVIPAWGDAVPEEIGPDRGIDGVIGMLKPGHELQALMARGIPVINVAATSAGALPTVIPDDHAIGRLAAEHVLSSGSRHLGFYHSPDRWCSPQRRDGFLAAAAAAHLPVHQFAGHHFSNQRTAIADWLRHLPQPIGIFAHDDIAAREVAEAGRSAGLQLPDQIALLGCGDDPVICDLSWLPLSSVHLPAERIGYEAGLLMKRMLAGEPPPRAPLRIAPIGITSRRSSDPLAIADPDLRAAVAFIRQHAATGITVTDVVTNVAVSRRSLERHFRSALNHSPAEAIRRTRIDQARRLLTTTNQSMRQIARATGFSAQKHLIAAFKRQHGLTPGVFRSRFRAA